MILKKYFFEIVITFGVFIFSMSKKNIFFNMRFDADDELYLKATKLAQKRGISLAGLIRMLLVAELEKEKPTS